MKVIGQRKLLMGAILSLSLFFVYILERNTFASAETKLLAFDGTANDRFGCSVSISGDTALVGADADDDSGINSGSAYIFHHNGSSWVQEQKLLASDGAAGEYFGQSVFISGDVALVGAPYDEDKGTDSGSAYVFRRNGSSWVQEQKLLASDAAAGDRFGSTVSISGDAAMVGAEGDDDKGTDSGSAYVFRYDGSNWVQEQKLLASDGFAVDGFGNSVSISGDVALVGALADDDRGSWSGSAYLFRFNGSSWVQEQKLVASDGMAGDEFGRAVSISGDVALVGADFDDDSGTNSGAAYVFRYDSNSWIQEQKLYASDSGGYHNFGRAVSISGDVALIGTSYAASAYVFRWTGIYWVEDLKLLASDGEGHHLFGNAVSISGDVALVGAHADDDNGSNSGSAYIFETKGKAMPWIIIGTWSNGIWYWDESESKWTKMAASTPTGDIAAGDFTGDGSADIASCWSNGLWYQDGDTLDWAKVSNTAPTQVTAGDVTGDGRFEIIGTWSNGIWYWDESESKWTKMAASTPTGDIAAGDFTGDGSADVASCWSNGLWYQDGDTLDWTKVSNTAPTQLTAGDVTGDGRDEIIGTWSNGIWYYDVANSEWTRMTTSNPIGDIAAGDFTGDGKADVTSCWSNGLWYQDGATLEWTKVSDTAPTQVTAGDLTGN